MGILFKRSGLRRREFTFFLVEPVLSELDFLKDGDVVDLDYRKSHDRLMVFRKVSDSQQGGPIGYVPRKYQKRLLRAMKKEQNIEVVMKQVYNGDKFELSCVIKSPNWNHS